jgi:hypothetical protein
MFSLTRNGQDLRLKAAKMRVHHIQRHLNGIKTKAELFRRVEHVAPGFLLPQVRPPFGHSFLGLFEDSPVLLTVKEGQKFLQGQAAVANQSDLYRIPQPDATRIDIDLNAMRLA